MWYGGVSAHLGLGEVVTKGDECGFGGEARFLVLGGCRLHKFWYFSMAEGHQSSCHRVLLLLFRSKGKRGGGGHGLLWACGVSLLLYLLGFRVFLL